jgi:hypothetical protein
VPINLIRLLTIAAARSELRDLFCKPPPTAGSGSESGEAEEVEAAEEEASEAAEEVEEDL